MGSILEEATKDMAAIKSGSASKGQKKAAAVAEEEGAKKLLSEVKKPKMEDTAQEKTLQTEAAQQGILKSAYDYRFKINDRDLFRVVQNV